jgi:hypothetical protein
VDPKLYNQNGFVLTAKKSLFCILLERLKSMKFKEIFLTVVLRYPINRDTLGNHGIYASSILFPLFFLIGEMCASY